MFHAWYLFGPRSSGWIRNQTFHVTRTLDCFRPSVFPLTKETNN